jgi:endonuclease G
MKPHFLLTAIALLFSFAAVAVEEIIHRQYYTLSYNEDHEVPNWVSYELDHYKLQNCVKRANRFKEDPLVSTGSTNSEDYRGSGFDRGHLLPAGDMKFSKQAMSDTFYFSNMSPQPPRFNRLRWAKLESLMRAWALKYKKIWIVTGPVLENNLPTIGKDNVVSVPNLYFKVILRKIGTKFEGIGFLMSTDTPHAELKAYVTSINEVEAVTNIDFFQFLDDEVEHTAEEEVNLAGWDFNGKFEYLPCQTSVAQ